MKQKIALVIEGSSEGDVWGRVVCEDNLIVESAADITKLKRKMKKLLNDFHSLAADEVDFEIQYDITGLFEDKKYLNASVVADLAGISRGLMRQYAAGIKYPSEDRLKKIETTIHSLGNELASIKVAPPKKKVLEKA